MQGSKGKICYVSSVICEFKGEFIRTLEAIEKTVNNAEDYDGVVYVFPEASRNLGFMNEFVNDHTVYFIPNPPKGNMKKLFNFIISLASLGNRSAIKSLQKIIEDENVSVLHSHFEEYDFVCYEVARKNNINLFVHYHDALIDSYLQIHNKIIRKLKLSLIRMKYNKITKLYKMIAVSSYCYAQLSQFVKHSENIYLITNCINLDYIQKKKSFNNQVKTFGSIVTREPKGIRVILEALQNFYNNELDIKARLICTSTTANIIKSEYPQLLSCGMLDILEPTDDINTLLTDIDVYISASFFETFSYGIAESLAYGLPVIMSDIPSTNWAVESNNTEVFVNKNSQDLYDKMLKLYKNGIDKDNCVSAMEFIRTNYNIDKLINEVLELYKGVKK